MRQRYCKSFGNFAQLNRIRTRSFKLYWLYVVKNSDLWAYGVLLWILSDCNALSCVNLYIQFIICHNYSFHAVFCVLPVFDFFQWIHKGTRKVQAAEWRVNAYVGRTSQKRSCIPNYTAENGKKLLTLTKVKDCQGGSWWIRSFFEE